MKNKKGFTLIELLAVIIILGVLMIIAIPSVTTYIQNSRKSAYVDTAAAYVDAVRNKVNEAANMKFYSTDTLYMVPVGHESSKSCVSVETGGQSPFSDKWNYAYVGVTYSGEGYDYYFIAEDGAAQGVPFMDQKTLTKEGTSKIYSSTSDTEYSSNVGDTLHTALVNIYAQSVSGKVDHYQPTTATTFANLLSKTNSSVAPTKIQFIYSSTSECSNQGDVATTVGGGSSTGGSTTGGTVTCQWVKDSGHFSLSSSGQAGAVQQSNLPECNQSKAGQTQNILDCGAGKKACKSGTSYTCNTSGCSSANLVYSWKVATCQCN